MSAAWHVGRLRAALPLIASSLVERVDDDLAALPDFSDLSDADLMNVIQRVRQTLVSLHGHEVLAGLLDDPASEGGQTGASAALRALSLGHAEGFSDEQIMSMNPEVLALTPPAVGHAPILPETGAMSLSNVPAAGALGPREALRMRVRWVQELSARAGLGTRRQARALGPPRISRTGRSRLALRAVGPRRRRQPRRPTSQLASLRRTHRCLRCSSWMTRTTPSRCS